jgi:hypothetical protein
VTLKNAVFWDVEPCRSCVNRRFGGTSAFLHLRSSFYVHLQIQRLCRKIYSLRLLGRVKSYIEQKETLVVAHCQSLAQ